MFFSFTLCFLVFALVSGYPRYYGVAAHRSDDISKLGLRQDNSEKCSAACANFNTMSNDCNTPHCGCFADFFNAEGQCLLCQSNSSNPADVVNIKFLLDAEVALCHRDGIETSYSLPLDPAAAAILQRVYHADSVLRTKQMVFLALQIIGGHIGIFLVLVLAVFSRQVHRDPTFFNFLLCFRCRYSRESLCIAQVALTNGAQVMTASSTLSLVIRLWLDLRTAICGETKEPKKNRRITVLVLPIVVLTLPKKLIIAPYVLFLAFGLVAHFHSEQPLQGNFYCISFAFPSLNHLYSRNLQFVYGVILAISLITVALEVFEPSEPANFSDSVIRSASSNFSVLADMMQAAIPLLGTIILGTRSDILGAVVFWRRNDAVKA
ncbi:hypothetical protein BU17DRAFT_71921 [Hysterangium stoloniferum]|nr:hypothetical protein BU17DRAFT_71921 [Hysterangium stoloniferum]